MLSVFLFPKAGYRWEWPRRTTGWPAVVTMDFEALRILSIVAREGSLQGAARAGAGARTTLRRRLDDLEESLGVPLFRRSASGIELTEAGAVLARRAERLLAEAEALLATTRDFALNPDRPLRLSGMPGGPPFAHAALLRLIKSAAPEVRVEFTTRITGGPPDPRNVDLCLTIARTVPRSGFRVFTLAVTPLQLVTSAEYLEQHPPIETVDDLRSHQIMAWRAPDEPAPQHLPLVDGGRIPIEPVYVCDDIRALREMAMISLGLAYIPHRNDLEDENLVAVLPEQIGTTRTLRLLVSRNLAESPRVQGLSEMIEATLVPDDEFDA